MSEFTRRKMIQGLGIGAAFGAGGCALNAGKVKLVDTNAETFTGALEVAGGRLWLKQAADLPNPSAFIFDTGAALTTIYRDEEKYGARAVGEVDVSSIGETVQRKTIAIDPIRLGPSYALPSQHALRAAQANPFVSSALLGRYSFDKQVLDLDFQTETYRVSTRDARNEDYPDAHREWTLGVRGNPLAFDIRVDGVKTAGVFDTGLPGAMALFPDFLKKYDIMSRAIALGPYTPLSGSTGKLSLARMIKVSEISLYGQVFKDIWVFAILGKDVPSPGIWGTDVLVGLEIIKHFKFTMDFIKRRRYLITATQDDAVLGTPLYSSSKWAQSSLEGVPVLYEKSDLENASRNYERRSDYIRAGNPRRILSLNGFDLGGDFDRLALARSRPRDAAATYVVESGSGTETVIVEPELFA